MPAMRLPDGSEFGFWDDTTPVGRTWHVGVDHPAADDAGPGTAEQPWRSLARAAASVGPGECVLVHGGIYRETLRPVRGGTGPAAMVAFAAAPGERPVIRASEVWQPEAVTQPATDGAVVWWGELAPELFQAGEQPFLATNLTRTDWFPWQRRPEAELQRAHMRRGQVFQDGRRLRQVWRAEQVARRPGSFWVADDGRRLLVRLFDDAEPVDCLLEVSTRAQCIAPRTWGLGYIRLSGLACEHAAGGVPFPQYGAVSTACGHHWIIEDCEVREANALAMDIGHQQEAKPWRAEGAGGHIVRRNRIARCGLAGLAGCHGVDGSLIEGNIFEDLGHLGLEHVYEAAAIKLHWANRVLIRDNVIRRLRDCCGIWMDYQCGNNRLTGNRIHDVTTVLAGIYVEANHAPHRVDGNVLWNLHDVVGNDPPKDGIPGGIGISSDVSDHTWIEHNLIVRPAHFAIACHLAQGDRQSGGRSALCRDMRVRGNLVLAAPLRVLFARRHDNRCEGNVYGGIGARACFTLEEPGRVPRYDLVVWREVFGWDQEAVEIELTVSADGDQLALSGRVATELPASTDPDHPAPGPLTTAQWAMLREGGEVVFLDPEPT